MSPWPRPLAGRELIEAQDAQVGDFLVGIGEIKSVHTVCDLTYLQTNVRTEPVILDFDSAVWVTR